MFTYIDISDK